MKTNPELQKNIWLEMNSTRLIVMPVILAVVYLFVFVSSDHDYDLAENLNIWSSVIMIVLLYLWGVRQASDSVISEVNSRTWSSQQLSQITPLEMTVGKLLGSTIYAWYGAAFAVITYVISSFSLPNSFLRLKMLVVFILGAIFVQAVTLTLSLLGVEKNREQAKIGSSVYFILGIVLALSISSWIFQVNEFNDQRIEWYGIPFLASNFILLTAVFFTGWSVLGLHRTMRLELQFENSRDVWYLFVLSMMLFMAGFVFNVENKFNITYAVMAAYTMIGVGIVFTYFLLFSESKDLIKLKQFATAFTNKNMERVNKLVPLWLGTFTLTAVIVLISIVIGLFFPERLSADFTPDEWYALFPLAVLLFMIRDISLLLFLNFSSSNNRPDVATFVYLAVLYLLIPAIFDAAGWEDAVGVLVPTPNAGFAVGILPIAVQAVVMAFLTHRRWQLRMKEQE